MTLNRWLVAFLILWLLPCARGAEPTTSATQQPDATPRVKSLSELIRADIRDRKLVLTLVLPGSVLDDIAADRSPSIQVTADDRWIVDADARAAKQNDRGALAAFALSCESRRHDRWSELQLTAVTVTDAGVTTIEGSGRVNDSYVGVTLVQDVPAGVVRFTVEKPRRARARPLDIDQAADFVQLFNEHEPQVRRYLMPLLKELAGENVLRPRAGDVYRAFTAIAPDPAITAQLKSILPDLDADAAPQRNAASAKLDHLGRVGVLAALRLDPSELSPEQRGRIDALVDRNSLWPDPATSAATDPHFLADCLGDDDAAVRRAALAALQKLAGRDIAFDVDAAPAARSRAVDELVDRLDELELKPAPPSHDAALGAAAPSPAPAEARPAAAGAP